MTENSDPTAESPYGGQAGSSGPPPRPAPQINLGQELRALRRSRNDRIIAGVCGGVARRLNLDPVLVRVVFAVATLITGVGVVVYVLGWLLMPEEDTDSSLIERALGRRRSRGRGTALVLSVLLILVAAAMTGALLGGDWGGLVLVLLIIAGIMWWLRRDRAAQPDMSSFFQQPSQPRSAADSTMTGPQSATPASPGSPSATTQPLPWGQPAASTPNEPPGYSAPVWPSQPPPPQPRQRSPLFRFVISGLLVLLGGLALADVAGASIAAGWYVASALALVGLGLLVGAWYGRSRGLIVLGVILAFALPVAAAIDQVTQFRGPSGRVVVEADSIAEGTGSYDHGAGEVIYELSQLDFTGRDEHLNIDLGAGSVQVIVPAEVDLEVDANVGLGDLRILDRGENSGVGVDDHVVDYGNDGPGGGRLNLNIDAGVGEVVVSRVPA
jgi:phage shock protein PspC (stress-responsive transcriptional regulator)